jgi:ankyrin repeat protein
MKDVLKNLPTGPKAYDYAYEEAMKRIAGHDADSRELAKQVLSWITCSRRPLSTSELQCALAVEVGESELDEENLPQLEDIVSVCAGLVTVDEESSIVRLVHYTTQEYFERTQRQWFPAAQTNITTICITYLSFDEFENGICQSDKEFEQRLQFNKLYNYAAHNWGHHARTASISCQKIMKFFKKQAQVEASSQALMAVQKWSGYMNSQNIPREITGLHLAAYFGVYEAVQFLIGSNSPDPKDSYGQTPLFYAIKNGHEAVVQLLLDKGAKLETKDQYGQTPLLCAINNGHEAIVQLLLDKGTKLETKDQYGQTPLFFAIKNKHEAIVQLLLDKGAELEIKNQHGRTPLLYATMKEHEAIVRLLLDKGAELETKDQYGQTPLLYATKSGHEAIVQLLLDKGAELETKDRNGRTPLLCATQNGHEAIVQLLLDKGAELETKDQYGWTPLFYATKSGHEAVVQLLLDKGAELETKDQYGQTPLFYATQKGHEAVVQLLLDNGADTSIENRSGWTALQLAALNGHVSVEQLLVIRGALEPEDFYGLQELFL